MTEPAPCPTCGAATRALDPIGGVGGPAVVECEAGHQSPAVTAVDIGDGRPEVGTFTVTPALFEPPSGATYGMMLRAWMQPLHTDAEEFRRIIRGITTA